ncbi:MAG: DUF445 family protein [Lysinibacillus sp.]
MDNIFVLMLFLGGIGAIVGAATNYMAIKMLFRPYKPIYFNRWRLPLTPGLIPKRREDLAIQLGKTVSDYLLTPATIKQKFLSPEIRKSVETFAAKKLQQEIFQNEKTLNDWLKLAGFSHMPQLVEQKFDEVIHVQLKNVQNVLETKTIRELMSDDVEYALNSKVQHISSHILLKGEDYFTSPEGVATIKGMLDDFLNSKGSLGGMIQMFVGDGSALVEKIQRELLKFLQAPGTTDMLNRMIGAEWEKLKDRHAAEFLQDVNFEKLEQQLQGYVRKELALQERLNKTITDYWPQGEAWALDDMLPKLLNRGFTLAEGKIEDVLQKLNLQEVVRQQVDSYPIAMLEDLVLGIISKELRLITWLGGIIGGLVGVIQALIMYFIN